MSWLLRWLICWRGTRGWFSLGGLAYLPVTRLSDGETVAKMGHPAWGRVQLRGGCGRFAAYLTYSNVPQRSVEFEIALKVKTGAFWPEKRARRMDFPEA
jgi:hypothetical protein